MKPFKWIKKHPIEAAAIAAALVATGGTAAGWFGPAAAAGEAAAGAAGAAGAGGASLAGTAAAAELAAPLASGGSLAGWGAGAGLGGSSALLGAFGPEASMSLASSLLSAPEATPFITAGVEPFAMGATTAQPGVSGMFGPQAAQSGSKAGWKLGAKEAMQLAQMTGGGLQEQRPLGAPQDSGNPWQRQAMMTQEQITKKWLLQNDPNTYARIYGAPQGASYA